MTTLATDDFNRANQTPVTGNWVTQTGSGVNVNLISNVIRNAFDSDDTAANYSGATWPNDHWSQADITATTGYSLGDGPGIGLRMAAAANTYYRLVASHITGGNNCEIGKKVTGTYTSIANRNSGAWTDGATWYAEVQGSTLILKLSGVQVGASATDSAITSGRAGVSYSCENTSQIGTWDNWSGGDFAGAAQDTPELYGRRGLAADRQLRQLIAQ